MKMDIRQKIGFIAAMVGLALAIIAGIFSQFNGIVILVLVILGVIYGALSVNTREIMLVLVAAVALIVVSTAGFDPLNDVFQGLGDAVNWIVTYMGRLAAPAAVIAAVRALFDIAKSP
jgi:uncharacterized membrane protein